MTQSQANKSRKLGLLMVSITALNWSVLAFFLKDALQYVSLGNLAAFRFLMSFVGTIFILMFQQGIGGFTQSIKDVPKWGLLAGLALAWNYLGYMKGLEFTTPTHAQVLIQLSPLLLALLGILILKERLLKRQWFGMCLASAGLAFFYWEQLQTFQGDREVFMSGNIWIISASLTWVVYALIQKLLTKKLNPQLVNFWIYLAATLAFSKYLNFEEFYVLTLEQWAVVLFLGFNTLISYGALAEALRRIPAYQVSVVIVLNPIGSMLIVWLLPMLGWTRSLGAAPNFLSVIGALAMILGTVIVLWKSGKKNEN